MASTVKFIPNRYAPALLARTVQMEASMMSRAADIVENAAMVAPYGYGAGGHYRDMLEVAGAVIDGKAAARANAHKWTSGLIEFGTSDTPTFAPLRNGADMAGLTLTGRTAG